MFDIIVAVSLRWRSLLKYEPYVSPFPVNFA